MNTTAHEIQTWALVSLDRLLTTGQYKNRNAMHAELAKFSGVSVAMIQAFHKGTRPNLSVATLDKLVAAIKIAYRIQTAA